uniref:Hcr2-2A n=1 Tax=Solanum tuberosum TaxID=4113 RepID=M1C9F6_SOLTU
MQNNKLSGSLPTNFSIVNSLINLNLHGNELEGEIPRSLANCKKLQVLDLGDNHLNDTFPMWLGTLPELRVLRLTSNKLHGPIRPSGAESMFPNLQIIDLSYNAFSKDLPTSLFQNLKGMRTIDQTMDKPSYEGDGYYQNLVVVVSKGLKLEVVRILSLYTVIDLSNNKFEGYIPGVLGDLIVIRVLNLSHNGLQGPIPPSLGSLSVVESLDLSFNHLSGEIPQQLASLTYLGFLNLSHNYLQGCIPQGPQLRTFENNSYEGNDGLCGFPVSKGCGNDPVSETNYTVSALDNQESNSEFLNDFWNAALMAYGSGICIGLSIIYFMISTGNMKWLARIIEELEHKINMRKRKKQRGQRNYRRRNNRIYTSYQQRRI